MENLKLSNRLKNNIQNFSQRLKDIHQDNLISIILYGSAASGEFTDKHSNLNLLVVLKNTDLEILKKTSKIISKFSMISPLFLTEDYIRSSTDIFPIEFLDMQENYFILYGKDVLKEINVDTRNLRFQCEQELKAKLLNLRQLYLSIGKDRVALQNLLFKSCTSILHILRNVLRIKGIRPPYLKQDVLREASLQFHLDTDVWKKILAAKSKRVKLHSGEVKELFVAFIRELGKLVDIVDKL